MLGHTRTRLAATLVVSAVTALFFLCGGTVSASAQINPGGASASPIRSADLGTKHLRVHGVPANHAPRATAPHPQAADTGPVTLPQDAPTTQAPYGVVRTSDDAHALHGQHEPHTDSRGPPV